MPPISTCISSSLFERTDTNDTMITNRSNENQQNNTIETTTVTNNSPNKSSNMECKVIRDEVQSHNDDSSTNMYENTSVFASVSPLSCQETHQEQNSIQKHQQIETIINNHEIDNNTKKKILSSNLFDTQTKPMMAADSVVDVSLLENTTATEPSTNTCLKGVIPTMTTNLNNTFVASKVQNSTSSVSTKKSIKRKRPSSKHPTNTSNISNQLSLAINSSMENSSSHTSTTALSGNGTTGRWTVQEHEAFVRGLALYGREWKRVALDIPTRTSAQVRSHAQKYLTKMEKQLEFMNHRPTSTSSSSINTKTPPVAQYISSNEIINDTSGNVLITKSNQSPSNRFGNNNVQDDTTSSLSQHDIDGSPNNNDQNSNDEYMTMSDSVRQQAARILANPTTVEQEVRETITQLRKRYQLLQERIQAQQQQQHQQQQQNSLDKYNDQNIHRDHKTNTSSNSHRYNVTNHHHHDPPTIGTTTFYIPHHDHDDDELIALHVLQGLQKQQQQQQSSK